MVAARHNSPFNSLLALALITAIGVSYLLLYKSIVLYDEPSFVLKRDASRADDTWRDERLLLLVEVGRSSENRSALVYNLRQEQFDRNSVQVHRNGHLDGLLKTTRHPAARISKHNPVLFCGAVDKAKSILPLGRGYTKTVEQIQVGHRDYAVKYVGWDAVDIIRCVGGGVAKHACHQRANAKLELEAAMMEQLDHPNIIKLVQRCSNSSYLRDSLRGTAVVTELGRPIDIIQMLRLPWDERFKIALDLMSLLSYMQRSPIGSLVIRDFRVEQFVVVNGRLKLTDLDDVVAGEPACTSSRDCVVRSVTRNLTLPCVNATCHGFNAAYNLLKLYATFLSYVLRHEAPLKVKLELAEVARDISVLETNATDALLRMIAAAKRLGTRKEMGPIGEGQVVLRLVDSVNTSGDFYCPLSRSLYGCELAVDTLDEALAACKRLHRCRSIALTPRYNWLGQRIVRLYSNPL